MEEYSSKDICKIDSKPSFPCWDSDHWEYPSEDHNGANFFKIGEAEDTISFSSGEDGEKEPNEWFCDEEEYYWLS